MSIGQRARNIGGNKKDAGFSPRPFSPRRLDLHAFLRRHLAFPDHRDHGPAWAVECILLDLHLVGRRERVHEHELPHPSRYHPSAFSCMASQQIRTSEHLNPHKKGREVDLRATRTLALHEHINILQPNPQSPAQTRVHTTDDLHYQRSTVRDLAIKSRHGLLCVLLIFVRQSDGDPSLRVSYGGVGDRTAALEDSLVQHNGKAVGQKRKVKVKSQRTSTSAADVPATSPETSTTFPLLLAPLICNGPPGAFTPVASLSALSARPKFSFGGLAVVG